MATTQKIWMVAESRGYLLIRSGRSRWSRRASGVRIHEVRPMIGAGFITLVCGDIMLMPGLPSHPAYERVELVNGEVQGV